jgi:ketosteroid isomerase-like protein
MEQEIRDAEAKLVEAMKASDVATLDHLLDERLVFVGPDGALYRKEDDLARHRTGAQRITQLEVEQMTIVPHGSTAVAVVDTRLAGSIHGAAFAGRYRYLRVWQRAGAGWVVIAGQVTAHPGMRA